MLKYTETQITFSEFPDEISLCINISGCPNRCPGCHSPELWEDVGSQLDSPTVIQMINKNPGISCIGFMGGDQSPEEINKIAEDIRFLFPKLKIGWYSGRVNIPEEINYNNFDYIKTGPYIEEKGPLNNPSTNQRMFEIIHYNLFTHNDPPIWDPKTILTDITDKFWK